MKKILIILVSLCTITVWNNSNCPVEVVQGPVLSEEYPGISIGILSLAKVIMQEKGTLFCFNRSRYSFDLLENEVPGKLTDPDSFRYIEEYVENLYVQYLFDIVLTKADRDQAQDNSLWEVKKTVEKYLTQDIILSQNEAMDYYERNSIWFAGATFAQVEDQVKAAALEDKKEQYFYAFLADAGKSIAITISKPWLDTVASQLRNHRLYRALQNGQSSIVIFSYGCCKPDVMLSEIALLKDSQETSNNLIHIDTMKEYDLSRMFKIKINPTTLIFNPKGDLLFTLPYYRMAEEIQQKLYSIDSDKSGNVN